MCLIQYIARGHSTGRLVFSRFLDLRRNLGNAKEKTTTKTCSSCEKNRQAPSIYQVKFCVEAFF